MNDRLKPTHLVLVTLFAASIAIVLGLARSARWSRALPHPGPAAAAATAALPWLVLLVLISMRGLWWTQRPVALRLLLTLVVTNWSLAVGLQARGAAAIDARDPPRRMAIAIAAVLIVLAIDGAAFGFTPFGCAV